MCKKDIYQEITNQIISDLEKGLPVWEKPWEKGFMGFPTNAFSKSFYSGVNTLILWLRQSQTGFETSQWMTFLQVKNLGGSVKKGEKATAIVFYKKLVITDKESEEKKTIPLLKTHAVFNLSQTKGLEHLIKNPASKEEPLFQDVKKAEQTYKESPKRTFPLPPLIKPVICRKRIKSLCQKRSSLKLRKGFILPCFTSFPTGQPTSHGLKDQ